MFSALRCYWLISGRGMAVVAQNKTRTEGTDEVGFHIRRNYKLRLSTYERLLALPKAHAKKAMLSGCLII